MGASTSGQPAVCQHGQMIKIILMAVVLMVMGMVVVVLRMMVMVKVLNVFLALASLAKRRLRSSIKLVSQTSAKCNTQ